MEGPHKRTRPTVRDVARQAEVSVWTASNTFSNPDRVAAATRQRVLDAADALGYVGPNPGARALALGRSNLVAMATSEPERLLSDPAAALIAQGVLTVCSRAGISMVLTAQADELLVDGRIEFRGAFDATRRPCVTVADVAVTNVPTIRPNLDPGIAALADYLRSMGHRRVAMLSVPGDENRLDGAGLDEGQGEGVLRLDGRETTRGTQDGFADLRGWSGDAGGGQELVEDHPQDVGTGQLEVETGDLALQLGGQGFPDAKEQEEFPCGLGVVQGVAQLADEERVAVLQQGTEVSQEHEAVTVDGFDLLEGSEGIGTITDRPAGSVDEAGGEAPGMEGTTEAFGGGLDLGFGTDLFGGAQKKAGVTGPRISGKLIFHGFTGHWLKVSRSQRRQASREGSVKTRFPV